MFLFFMNHLVMGLYKTLQDAGKEINSKREGIRAGTETLGSKFDDFVFCSIGANPVDWEPFYSLDEQMKNSGGQEVLVVCSEEKPRPMINYTSPGLGLSGCNGLSQNSFGPPMKLTSTDYDMAYGVLTGKGLDFDLDKSEIIFPNGRKHVRAFANSIFPSSLTFKPLEVRRGRIRENVGDLVHLYNGDSLGFLSIWARNNDSKILVGPEVGQYFENLGQGSEIYSEIKKKL